MIKNKSQLEQINRAENDLIEQFKLHPIFLAIDTISWNDFLKILIQRRFFSLSIVNIYEFVIDALEDKSIKQTVRSILYEEYPRTTKGDPLPSHREFLFQDLLNLGATHEMILKTLETPITKEIRDKSYDLLASCLGQKYSQLGLVTFLRFWAEVLVSTEYSCLWKRISERLSSSKTDSKLRSEFYYFHAIHDEKGSDIGKKGFTGGLTHSQELASHLEELILSDDALLYCIDIEKEVYQLKVQFYDQFIIG
jgi:hypothetical protein